MLAPLTRQTLRGIWIPLIVCWTDDDRLDERRYAREIRSFAGTGIAGMYTGGTTGEFYAQDDADFERITAVTCAEAHAIDLPVQIGCTALSTSVVARRICIARRHGADAIQIALPCWLELADDEVIAFMRDIADAAQDTPLVLYQTGRAKKVLSPQLLAEIARAVPQLIGTKDTGCSPETLQEFLRLSPDLAIFGGDRDIAEKMRGGGKGAYSAVALLNPRFVADLHRLAAEQQWEQALQKQGIVTRLFDEALIPVVLRDRLMDSAIDRVQRIVGGGDVNLNCQKPYRSASPAHVEQLRAWCQTHAPELLSR